jgi:hypothetical protein
MIGGVVIKSSWVSYFARPARCDAFAPSLILRLSFEVVAEEVRGGGCMHVAEEVRVLRERASKGHISK